MNLVNCDRLTYVGLRSEFIRSVGAGLQVFTHSANDVCHPGYHTDCGIAFFGSSRRWCKQEVDLGLGDIMKKIYERCD